METWSSAHQNCSSSVPARNLERRHDSRCASLFFLSIRSQKNSNFSVFFRPSNRAFASRGTIEEAGAPPLVPVRTMLQFPGFMTQFPESTRMIPSSFLLPSQWPQPQNEELLLALEESDFEDKCNEIRKLNSNLVVIGKSAADIDKDAEEEDADDDDPDNADESEGDEFEQETV